MPFGLPTPASTSGAPVTFSFAYWKLSGQIMQVESVVDDFMFVGIWHFCDYASYIITCLGVQSTAMHGPSGNLYAYAFLHGLQVSQPYDWQLPAI